MSACLCLSARGTTRDLRSHEVPYSNQPASFHSPLTSQYLTPHSLTVIRFARYRAIREKQGLGQAQTLGRGIAWT